MVVNPITGLTEHEMLVHQHLMEAYSQFIKLPREHPDDLREFAYAVHLIQGLLAMRSARRSFPGMWKAVKPKESSADTLPANATFKIKSGTGFVLRRVQHADPFSPEMTSDEKEAYVYVNILDVYEDVVAILDRGLEANIVVTVQ